MKLKTVNHKGIDNSFFFIIIQVAQTAKIALKKIDIIHPVITTNSVAAWGTVKCVWRINKHKIKNRLQMNATLLRNKRPRMK